MMKGQGLIKGRYHPIHSPPVSNRHSLPLSLSQAFILSMAVELIKAVEQSGTLSGGRISHPQAKHLKS